MKTKSSSDVTPTVVNMTTVRKIRNSQKEYNEMVEPSRLTTINNINLWAFSGRGEIVI